MDKELTVIDLFSGCGGMSWGLHKSRFKIVAALDIWDVAIKTFSINHPNTKTYSGDIKEIDPKRVLKDLGLKRGELTCLVGGPPCVKDFLKMYLLHIDF